MLDKLQKVTNLDWLLAAGIILVSLGIGWNLKNEGVNKVEVSHQAIKVSPTAAAEEKNEIEVDVEGEVIHPGVYKLKKGDRVKEALVAAGGLALKADRKWVEVNINQAELLKDGQKILIPSEGDRKEINLKSDSLNTKVLGVSSQIKSKTININSASLEELDTLPGIGPSLAQRIINYREEKGGFKSAEEIKLVSGIGDKLFEKIKDEIEI
ncbi:MAG TPA: helix-hairpin-helix domain-containing protein [Patescibacteria group bacterium]